MAAMALRHVRIARGSGTEPGMRDLEIADWMDEDAATAAAILESLARAEADVAAGRVIEGEVVLAELRAMIAAQQAKRGHGETGR